MAAVHFKDCLGIHLAPFLGLAELARIQATDSAAQELLATSSAWHACIAGELPELDVAAELLSPPHRAALAKHFRALLEANFAEKAQVKISTLEDADRLGKLVKGMSRAAATHTADGGGAACVAVATLKFPSDLPAQATKSGGPGMCCADPICFAIPEELREALHCPSAMLELHFAWEEGKVLEQGKLFVRVEEVWLHEDVVFPQKPPEGIEREMATNMSAVLHRARGSENLLVDLSMRHRDFTLHQRGGVVQVGREWKSMGARGVSSVSNGKAAACKALSEGIVCAICVREGRPMERKADSSPNFLFAHALHLDQVRSAW